MRVLVLPREGEARIRDAATGAVLATLTLTDHPSSYAAFSPDGARVAIVNSNGTVRVSDAATGRLLATLDGNIFSSGSTPTFSPDGARVLVGYQEKIGIWDSGTGRRLGALAGEYVRLLSGTFSLDGTRIAIIAEDGTIHLRDVAHDAELRTFPGDHSNVIAVAFNRDGSALIAAHKSGTFVTYDLWPARPALIEKARLRCGGPCAPSIKERYQLKLPNWEIRAQEYGGALAFLWIGIVVLLHGLVLWRAFLRLQPRSIPEGNTSGFRRLRFVVASLLAAVLVVGSLLVMQATGVEVANFLLVPLGVWPGCAFAFYARGISPAPTTRRLLLRAGATVAVFWCTCGAAVWLLELWRNGRLEEALGAVLFALFLLPIGFAAGLAGAALYRYLLAPVAARIRNRLLDELD